MQGKTALWRQLLHARRRASITPSSENTFEETLETEAEAAKAAETTEVAKAKAAEAKAAEAADAKAMSEMARNQKWIFFNLESPVVTTKWLWDEELKEVMNSR